MRPRGGSYRGRSFRGRSFRREYFRNGSERRDLLPPRVSAGFEAEGIGKLVVDGAVCLRLRLGSGESTAPLWMRGWGLEDGDGGPRVLDAGGRTVGRLGGRVKLSGGYITDRMVEVDAMVDGRTVRELLERCPGDYVLVSGHE